MKRDKIISTVKKLGNMSKESTRKDPYVLYKLDGNDKKANTIKRSLSISKTEKNISNNIKKLIKYGEPCYGLRKSSIKSGKIIARAKDKLYAIYKEKDTDSFYLLMFVTYEKSIENKLRKIPKKDGDYSSSFSFSPNSITK